MSTYGSIPTFNGADFFGVSTPPYQIGEVPPGAWPGGTITDVNVYFGGWTAAVNARLCIWDSSGNIIWTSTLLSVPQAANTNANGQGWVTVSGQSISIAAAGGGIIIGLWRDPAGKFVYSRDGTANKHYTGNNTSPGNLAGTALATGNIGAYVTYQPAPVTSGVSPNPVNINQSFTVTGSNFMASQGSGNVQLNGVSATITSWADTSITAHFAPGSFTTTQTSGSLVVNNTYGFTSNAQTLTLRVGGFPVWDSGSGTWKKHPLKVYDSASGTWKWRPLKEYDLASTTWKRRA